MTNRVSFRRRVRVRASSHFRRIDECSPNFLCRGKRLLSHALCPLPFKERLPRGFTSLDVFGQVDCAPTFCIKGEGGCANGSNSAYIGESP